MRTVLRAPALGGLIGAAIGYANALTPSLLPPPLPFLLLLIALGASVGFATGTLIEWALSTLSRLRPSPPPARVPPPPPPAPLPSARLARVPAGPVGAEVGALVRGTGWLPWAVGPASGARPAPT